MGCEIWAPEGEPRAGSPATLFCSSFPSAKPVEVVYRCVYCNEQEGLALCDWPDVKLVEIPSAQVVQGDRVIVGARRHRGLVTGLDLFTNYIRVRPKPGAKEEVWQYSRREGCWSLVERLGTCDRLCCWRHYREVGEDRHHCMGCWDRWQEVG